MGAVPFWIMLGLASGSRPAPRVAAEPPPAKNAEPVLAEST
jgi:hypothetical protein